MEPDVWENVEKHSEALLRELHSEMRSIRDADLKLLPFFFTISAFVLSANLLTILNASADDQTIRWVAAPLALFVCVFWWQLHELIEYNHNKYVALGQRVGEIWAGWKVAKFFGQRKGASTYGAGPGYRKLNGSSRLRAFR